MKYGFLSTEGLQGFLLFLILASVPSSAAAQRLRVATIQAVDHYILSNGQQICLTGIAPIYPHGTDPGGANPSAASRTSMLAAVRQLVRERSWEYEKVEGSFEPGSDPRGCSSYGDLWLLDQRTGIRITSLSELLLQEGYARVDPGATFLKKDMYERIQFEARLYKAGFWDQSAHRK